MVKAEQIIEHKSIERHRSPSRTSRDIAQKLEQHKRTYPDTFLTTLTHLIDCSERTSKLSQSFDLYSQRTPHS